MRGEVPSPKPAPWLASRSRNSDVENQRTFLLPVSNNHVGSEVESETGELSGVFVVNHQLSVGVSKDSEVEYLLNTGLQSAPWQVVRHVMVEAHVMESVSDTRFKGVVGGIPSICLCKCRKQAEVGWSPNDISAIPFTATLKTALPS